MRKHFDDAFQKLAHRFGTRAKLKAADLDGGKIEQVLDELGERMAGLADAGQIAPASGASG
jgi:ribosomal protein L12E/L44/L45/RPP1/RPP2